MIIPLQKDIEKNEDFKKFNHNV